MNSPRDSSSDNSRSHSSGSQFTNQMEIETYGSKKPSSHPDDQAFSPDCLSDGSNSILRPGMGPSCQLKSLLASEEDTS